MRALLPSTLRALVVLVGAVVLFVGASAEAVQTSIMDYEATITATESAVNLKCHPPHNECGDIIAANELLLGLPAGSIQLIGKIGSTSDGNPVAFETDTVQSPFNGVGVDLEPSWVCVDTGGLTDGCTLTLNFEDLENDWQIVKIIAKTGKIGSSSADDKDGVFVRSNGLLTTGIEDLQAAFISEAERDAWFAAIGGTGDNGKYSHLWVFGVESTPEEEQEEKVPEPGTVMLLGVGLLGLGAAIRGRRSR